jgi:hypothetical protein
MSTKIFNGIKFKSNSYEEVFSQLSEIRKTMRENYMKFANYGLTNYYYKHYDEPLPHGSDLYDIIKKDLQQITKGDFDELDCTLVIIPHKGELYGLYYAVGKTREFLLEAMDNIYDDFSYWDNTDPPEELPENEWVYRRIVWDEITVGNEIPRNFGTIFTFLSEDDAFWHTSDMRDGLRRMGMTDKKENN